MSKIICDVCGSRYPDSAEQCPICGCVPNAAVETKFAEPAEEVAAPARKPVRGGRFSKSNVRKRNRNQPVYDEPEKPVRAAAPVRIEEETDDFEEFEAANKKSGTLLNVLLVIVILALLAVSAYIFLQFFMPNFFGEDPVAPTEGIVETAAPETDAPTEAATEDANVACQQLVMEVTDITLHEAGEMYLLNAQALPENTTDSIVYISSNEEVATVNEEGRVTAVGEGSVVISMFCGEQQAECNVICAFSGETEAPTENAAEETEAPAENATEGEEATEAPTEKPAEQLKDVKLGVKTADMTFRAHGQQSTIKLTCKLENEEVTWTSADDGIATVSKDGVITRAGSGTTTITGQYGDQKVEIIVRCPRK